MEEKKSKGSRFFTEEELRTRYKEWEGMPEFVHGSEEPFKTIKVHFANQKDVDRFAELVQQNITGSTKWIWFPKLKKANLLKKVCVDADHES